MPKILYSPGYGAGWSTWNNDPIAKYMLTYQPIIDFLERGGTFVKDKRGDYVGEGGRLIKRLQAECKAKFGKSYICVAGAKDLKVGSVSASVSISTHDGYERIGGNYNDFEEYEFDLDLD